MLGIGVLSVVVASVHWVLICLLLIWNKPNIVELAHAITDAVVASKSDWLTTISRVDVDLEWVVWIQIQALR